jgi:hypothetical protein
MAKVNALLPLKLKQTFELERQVKGVKLSVEHAQAAEGSFRKKYL